MTQIHHWQSYFGVLDATHGGTRTLEQHAERHPNGMLDASPPAPGVHAKTKTIARVSGSCWIADCPKAGCGGAEFVNFDDPRFFCCSCRNVDFAGQPIAVKLPSDKQREQIEEQLLKRPDPITRHWYPDETVADLKAENLKEGVL